MSLQELNEIQKKVDAWRSDAKTKLEYAEQFKAQREAWTDPERKLNFMPWINAAQIRHGMHWSQPTVAFERLMQPILDTYGPPMLHLAELQLRDEARRLKLQADQHEAIIKNTIGEYP